jgi:hypothetical protein
MRIHDKVRLGLIDTFLSLNAKFHLTVKFAEGACEQTCIESFNTFLIELNNDLHNNEDNSGESHINGTVYIVHTIANNTNHLYILISDSKSLPDYENMNKLVFTQVKKVKSTDLKTCLCDYQLQECYDTKNDMCNFDMINHFDSEESAALIWLTNIGYLSARGINLRA